MAVFFARWPHLRQGLRRLARSTRGVAMIEFAICLPVLLVMYLGGYVVSDMIACNRKVTVAARALADLTSRNISPTATYSKASVDPYLNVVPVVMLPYSATGMEMRISSLQVCDASDATVIWSDPSDPTSSTKALSGTVTLPTGMVTSPMLPTAGGTCAKPDGTGAYFFLGEVFYPYRPVVGYGPINTTMLSDVVYMSPRLN